MITNRAAWESGKSTYYAFAFQGKNYAILKGKQPSEKPYTFTVLTTDDGETYFSSRSGPPKTMWELPDLVTNPPATDAAAAPAAAAGAAGKDTDVPTDAAADAADSSTAVVPKASAGKRPVGVAAAAKTPAVVARLRAKKPEAAAAAVPSATAKAAGAAFPDAASFSSFASPTPTEAAAASPASPTRKVLQRKASVAGKKAAAAGGGVTGDTEQQQGAAAVGSGGGGPATASPKGPAKSMFMVAAAVLAAQVAGGPATGGSRKGQTASSQQAAVAAALPPPKLPSTWLAMAGRDAQLDESDESGMPPGSKDDAEPTEVFRVVGSLNRWQADEYAHGLPSTDTPDRLGRKGAKTSLTSGRGMPSQPSVSPPLVLRTHYCASAAIAGVPVSFYAVGVPLPPKYLSLFAIADLTSGNRGFFVEQPEAMVGGAAAPSAPCLSPSFHERCVFFSCVRAVQVDALDVQLAFPSKPQALVEEQQLLADPVTAMSLAAMCPAMALAVLTMQDEPSLPNTVQRPRDERFRCSRGVGVVLPVQPAGMPAVAVADGGGFQIPVFTVAEGEAMRPPSAGLSLPPIRLQRLQRLSPAATQPLNAIATAGLPASPQGTAAQRGAAMIPASPPSTLADVVATERGEVLDAEVAALAAEVADLRRAVDVQRRLAKEASQQGAVMFDVSKAEIAELERQLATFSAAKRPLGKHQYPPHARPSSPSGGRTPVRGQPLDDFEQLGHNATVGGKALAAMQQAIADSEAFLKAKRRV